MPLAAHIRDRLRIPVLAAAPMFIVSGPDLQNSPGATQFMQRSRRQAGCFANDPRVVDDAAPNCELREIDMPFTAVHAFIPFCIVISNRNWCARSSGS